MMTPAVAPWWSPILYTLFGACLGFALTRFKDWLDERKELKRFFAGVRVELAAMNKDLKGTLKDATENREHLDKGERQALHLLTNFRRGIYDSQIGKLKDVSSPRAIELVQFYDRISNLERVKARFNSISFDLTSLSGTHEDDPRERPLMMQYRLALDEITRRITELLPILSHLLDKLQRG